MNYLEYLPKELVFEICYNLDLDDISKFIHNYILNNYVFWLNYIQNTGSSVTYPCNCDGVEEYIKWTRKTIMTNNMAIKYLNLLFNKSYFESAISFNNVSLNDLKINKSELDNITSIYTNHHNITLRCKNKECYLEIVLSSIAKFEIKLHQDEILRILRSILYNRN
jgi:hypothetical protein